MDEPFSHDLDTDATHSDATTGWDEPLLADDLEAAYLRALEATEAIEREIDEQTAEPSAPEDNPPLNDVQGIDAPAAEHGSATLNTVGADTVVDHQTPATVSDGPPPTSSRSKKASSELEPPRVSEKQVVEAALFVGGMPLTAKKLSSLFHTDHGFGFVECLIEELNKQYAEEGRPYSITLGEGGYRLTLLPEFEPVRNKVFGYGPKDVKLTQDALEVLSLVAYKQPITKSQIESLGKTSAGSVLRQLVQRELIRIDRAHAPKESKSKNDPPYVTTPRFLSLFGLGNLHDLPVAEDFAFK